LRSRRKPVLGPKGSLNLKTHQIRLFRPIVETVHKLALPLRRTE
jgi:hypothetical protein